MPKSVFRRKIYNEILEWKEKRSDKYALLIKGARRVGKSTIAEEFAKKEFKSYILIDFAHTSKEIIELFDDTYNLDFFFLQLQQLTGVRLYEKESVIIFDEVQLLPKARQAIKYLVADGRYKYIETGSLLSIKKNTKDILIPSEEHKISMYPMDFEEFLWAIDDEVTTDTIKMLLENKKSAGNALHRNLMRMFRLYMLVGGMPQAVETYIEHNNLQVVDETKREIIDLYEEDFTKIDGTGLAGDIYDAIPANLSSNASRYVLSSAREGMRAEQVRELIPDMLSSFTVNIAYHANNPDVGMALEKDIGRYKLFTSDIGLFITLAFKDKKYTENVIYNKLLFDKLETNLGYIYENVVAQMLVAKGDNLFYYTMNSETSNHLHEIDFLISVSDKICPIEVKSGNYRGHKSLDVFCDKFSSRIRDRYVVHTKDYKWENGINYIPVYMVPFI
ncbi:ATP-binding protein [Eubacterium ventriosum]|jgi:predicted AAA+ superfamily ATPase|uniref:ATP-binding protein n=1 Tax=Eubacterium ventriosum TaxID=39496 RepID=UPI00210B98A4|nr:AAA family ATPase [Eubacterium ventriosum]MCQ5339651.1 AAA family ATPase [Eubacterium ventriosum]